MERLAERNRFGVGICAAKCNKKYPAECPGCSKVVDAFEQLCGYEETGLTPEEITALIAERATLKKALEKLIFAIEAEHGDNGIHTEHSIAVNMAVKQAQEEKDNAK